MEIKKTNTKLVAQKKPSAEKKVEPEKPKEPIDIPKVKPETDQVKHAQTEDIKSKRERMFEQAKVRQQQIRSNAVIAKKNKRIFQITFAITLAVLLIFAPIYPNKEVKVNKRSYLLMSDLNITHPLGDYFSPFEFVRYQSEVKHGSEYIKHASVKYKLREMTVNVNIEEYKPLAKDEENNIYFYEDEEVVKKSDIDLYAPVITGFDQKTLEKLLTNLQALDYSVITQIDTIEYVGTEDDPDLLKMGMDGDNIVYIDMDQIKHKLPYYNQIKQIIDEKADGEPGIIHLDIGDYYEPK